MSDLAMANTKTEYNLRVCPAPGLESVWVKFATRGYARKLRREWDAAKPDQMLEIVLRFVEAWSLTDINGAPIPLPAHPRAADVLDDCEDALVIWLLREFQQFWLYELPNPKKN